MKATKKDAVRRFEKRYNCCQAVVCAYCEELGMKEEDAFRLAEGFGSGMGGLKETCGAVTGMFMVIGLKNSAGKMEDPFATKMDTYQKLLEAAEKFREKNGSLCCRDLKTEEGPQPLPCCMKCVEDASRIIDEMEY